VFASKQLEKSIAHARRLLEQSRVSADRLALLQEANRISSDASRQLRRGRARKQQLAAEALLVSSEVEMELGDIDTAFTFLAVAANLAGHNSSSDAPNPQLAKIAARAAAWYAMLGLPDRAAAFAIECFTKTSDGTARYLANVEACLALLSAGELGLVAKNVSGGSWRSFAQPVSSIVGILQDAVGIELLDERTLTEVGRDVCSEENRIAVPCVLTAANALVRRGARTKALELINFARARLAAQSYDARSAARLSQAVASLQLREGRPADALMDALEAWVTLAEARYLTASSSIRAGSYGTYGLATHTAMRAAVQLADWQGEAQSRFGWS